MTCESPRQIPPTAYMGHDSGSRFDRWLHGGSLNTSDSDDLNGNGQHRLPILRCDKDFVLSAADGHEGLELSRNYAGTIDLVITDVNMPRMNGTELCGHLMEERPGIKMLIMSGAGVRRIINQNANLPFLPKPFDGRTIRARVRAILAAPVQPAIHLQP